MLWNKQIGIVIVLFFIILALIFWSAVVRAPEPNYTILNAENGIEVREYPNLVIAEVQIKGDRDAALNQGFHLLADYIYGNNDRQQKISMTVPVSQQIVKPSGLLSEDSNNNKWIIRFFMPNNLSFNVLPKPNNVNVKLMTIPAKKFVVIRFSGFNSETNIQSHTDELMKYAEENNLRTMGTPIIAFYNPPWTLAFLRRNEVMLELADYKSAELP